MKNLMKVLMVLVIMNTYAQNHNQQQLTTNEANNSATESVNSTTQKPLYFGDTISDAISEAFKNKDINFIESEIEKVKEDSKIPNSYKNYWISYLLYYKSVFYKFILQSDSKASKTIDESIELIANNLSNTEDYALHAMCLSFSIQFTNMMKVPKISSNVNENAEKALSLNKNNIRAYCVLASHNLYTPKMFGGMKRVEEYAFKGLACPDSTDADYYAPHWGRLNIYRTLTKYYKATKDEENLKKITEKAKKEFPDKF